MILNKLLIKTLLYVCLLLSQITLANEINQQCYSYLTELVRSSNFPFNEIPKKNSNLLIDSDDGKVILAQVNYDKKDLDIPYDSSNTAINGWVKYYVDLQKLYNVSGDIAPDHPVEVSFDKTYANLFASCRKGILNSYQDDCIEVNNNALSNQSLYLPSKKFKISLSGRTYFYSAPDKKCKVSNELFIIKNDVVKTLGEFDNYYNVVYKKKNGEEVKGWIYKNNLIPVQEDSITSLDKEYSGDYLVSKREFIETINKSCVINNIYDRTDKQAEEDKKRCVLSKITFPYDKFLNLGDTYPITDLQNGKKLYIQRSNNFNIFIKTTKKSIDNGNYYVEVTLFTEKDNKILDSLIIYKEENDIDSFIVNRQYYFVSSLLTISILNISSHEEGDTLNFWKNYQIDNKGQIILLNSMTM